MTGTTDPPCFPVAPPSSYLGPSFLREVPTIRRHFSPRSLSWCSQWGIFEGDGGTGPGAEETVASTLRLSTPAHASNAMTP